MSFRVPGHFSLAPSTIASGGDCLYGRSRAPSFPFTVLTRGRVVRRRAPSSLGGSGQLQRLQILAHHLPDKLVERALRLPAEHLARLRRVADEYVNLRRAVEGRVFLHVFAVV